VKLFKKPKSRFYWYDFTVRGDRYRGSTQESGTFFPNASVVFPDIPAFLRLHGQSL